MQDKDMDIKDLEILSLEKIDEKDNRISFDGEIKKIMQNFNKINLKKGFF